MNIVEENKKRIKEWVEDISKNGASVVIAIGQKSEAEITIKVREDKERGDKGMSLLSLADSLEEIAQTIIKQHTNIN